VSTDQATESALPSLMSMPEIASLAGVHRPVVTTWRRRHRDFPAPVGGDATRPLFDAHQITEWLLRTDRASAEQVRTELSLHTLGSLSSLLPARDLIGAVTALLCLRYLDDEPLADGTADVIGNLRVRAARLDPQDEYLATEIFQLRRKLAGLAAETDDLVEAAWGAAAAFERVLAERRRFGAADLLVNAVTPALGRLMAEICGAREVVGQDDSPVITDLAVGPGDLLGAAARLLVPDHTPMFIGAEPDDYLARLARRRLLVHGIPAVDIDIRSGGVLPDEAGEPDVIITQIPYAPGESRSATDVLAKLDDISMRLRPGRIAVVLGPADVLVTGLPTYSPADRDRTRLIKTGMVEAVIQLPGGLLPFRPGYQPALWVLSSSFSSPSAGRILLADVSDQTLSESVVNDLVEDIITWRRDGYNPQAHTRVFSAQMRIADLVDPPRPLTARRPRNITGVLASAEARVSRISEIEIDLAGLAAQPPAQGRRRPTNSGIAAGSLQAPNCVAIGKLADRKQLTLIKGTRLRSDDITPNGHYGVIGPEEVLGQRQLGDLKIDRGTLADRYPQARLTEPGDVIVTTSPDVGAIVDDSGFSVVSFPARGLRIARAGSEQFTPRAIAALIAASQASRPAGAVRAAHRLEDLPLPLLSPDDLLRFDALLAMLEDQISGASREIRLSIELCKIATVGLTDGTLTFTSDPR
jgi:N-6 DNA Methylase